MIAADTSTWVAFLEGDAGDDALAVAAGVVVTVQPELASVLLSFRRGDS